MTKEAEAKLKAFSTLANRADLHPLDKERWRAFIIQEHVDRAPVFDSAVREQLMREGWREELARQLESEYYDGRLLLSDYDPSSNS